jgi:SAM-dependent methyltransferase
MPLPSDQAIRRFLYKLYWGLEKRVVPGLRWSQEEFAEVLQDELPARPVWLDLGCGRQMFPAWLPQEQERVLSRTRWVVGIDLDASSLRDHTAYPDKALASVYQLPFASGSFDLVSANMVVEHLADAETALSEIRRVLRPGGRFLFHTPNRDNVFLRIAAVMPEWLKVVCAWALENRVAEDVFPTHYRLNRGPEIEKLARAAKYRPVGIRYLSSSAVTAALGPLALPELLWLRWLRNGKRASLRTNIIGLLEAD